MLGGSSFALGRIFGIRIGVNASWFLILFLFIFWLSRSFTKILGDETVGYAAAVGAAVLFFGSIVLHELGHALAARRSGIEVSGIDLFFFGGVMKMNRDTDTPGKEFAVAIAGPLVTLGIVVVGTVVGIALAGSQEFLDAARLDGGAPSDVALLLVSFLVTMNAVLLVFNLVPAFPLAGGRIARAAAWKLTGDRGKATRFAATVGQGFAVLMVGLGIYLSLTGEIFDGLWLAVLGWLLGRSARAAVVQTDFTERLEGVTVADIMDAEPVTIPAELPAGRALDEFFLRYRWPWFPVVDAAQRFRGLLERDKADEVPEPSRASSQVGELVDLDEKSLYVSEDAPLDTLLGNASLRRFGALMAVDAEGRLSGVITQEQVGRALRDATAASTP